MSRTGEVLHDLVSALPAGIPTMTRPQTARFWGASVNGEKVFFTSDAELTKTRIPGRRKTRQTCTMRTGGVEEAGHKFITAI